MDTFLLTGGAGFIGSHLLEELLQKKNNKVIVIDNFNDFYDYTLKVRNIMDVLYAIFSDNKEEKLRKHFSNMDKIYIQMKNHLLCNIDKEKFLSLFIKEVNSMTENFVLHYTDIRNQKELDNIFSKNNIGTVIHFAAMAGVRPSFDNPGLYEEVNVGGTINILEIMKKYDVNRFICASSSSVYGNNQKLPFSEEDNIGYTLSPYAHTKKSCEDIGHLYWKYFNINTIMLRFFTVFGPRQRPDLAIHKFLNLMAQGAEIPFFGDGSSGRDYTYIKDIISGIIKSIEYMNNNKNCYEIFNLGNSNIISLDNMVNILEKVSCYNLRLKIMDFQQGDMPITYADISKSKNLLGYQPETSFMRGIEKFYIWYKDKI